MADPTRYTPGFNYSGWEADHPTEPKPGAELDNDFALIRHSIDETIRALRDVRRSDGKVQNAAVDFDALSPAVKAAIANSDFDYEVIDDLLAKDANLSDLADKDAALENLGLSDVLVVPAAADVSVRTFGAEVSAFRTNGYTWPGDGGQALYVRGQQRPGAIADADGDWWELVPDGGNLNVLWFGATPDTDEKGEGTDSTAAIKNAIALATAINARRVFFPNVGTGIYKINGDLGPIPSGLHVDGCGSALYNTASSGYAFYPKGQLSGPEVALGATASKGDSQIATASAHGLSAGDWCLLVSQRQAQIAQPSGANSVRLGDATSLPGTYFAEPLRVKEVTSDASFTTEQRLHYTDYRPNNSAETVSGSTPRSAATVQKIEWVRDVRITNFRYLTEGANYIRAEWCLDCEFTDVESDGRDQEITAVVLAHTHRCKVRRVSHRQNEGVASGLASNSFRDTSSWDNEWHDLYGENLYQAVDCSYFNGTYPGRYPRFFNLHMKRCRQAFNTHQAIDGGLLDGLLADDCDAGINHRSPNWIFDNYRIISTTGGAGNFAGLTHLGWARGTQWLGGRVEGYVRGFLYDRTGNLAIGPAEANLELRGTTFLRCQIGAFLRDNHGSASTPTAGRSHIRIIGNSFVECENWGVQIREYRNAVVVQGNYFTRFTGSSPIAVDQRADAVEPVIEGNVFDDIGPNSTAISTANSPDTATFPDLPDRNPLARLGGNLFIGSIGARHTHGGVNRTPISRQAGPGGPVEITAVDMVTATHVFENEGQVSRVYVLGREGSNDVSMHLGTGAAPRGAGLRWDSDTNVLNILAGNENRVFVTGQVGHFRPIADATQQLGGASNMWSEVFAETGDINVSDERLKQDIRPFTEDEVAALMDVSAVVYRFRDAVQAKGAAARDHVGVIAQQVAEAFTSRGLDPFRYGFLCGDYVYDRVEWTEEVEENGQTITVERYREDPRICPETGEHMFQLSVRYDELLTALWAADRQRLTALENRVSQLEA